MPSCPPPTTKQAVELLRTALALDFGDTKATFGLLETYYDIQYITVCRLHCAKWNAAFRHKSETSRKVVEAIYKEGHKEKGDKVERNAVRNFKIADQLNPG